MRQAAVYHQPTRLQEPFIALALQAASRVRHIRKFSGFRNLAMQVQKTKRCRLLLAGIDEGLSTPAVAVEAQLFLTFLNINPKPPTSS